MLIDTHTHIYDEAFDDDRASVIARAVESGVGAALLPAVDSQSHDALFRLSASHPGMFFPMMGLHPTSVNDNPRYGEELRLVEEYLKNPSAGRVYAVGEVGLDLYWSRDWQREQTEVFERQIELALEHDLPLVIHTRDCWPEMLASLNKYRGAGLRGVMHSFSGTYEDYLKVKELGDFAFGIGGVVTYKNSLIAAILPRMDVGDLVLETDAPYLPPVPHRGRRNESSYLKYICDKVAELLDTESATVEATTTRTAIRIFGLPIATATPNRPAGG